MMTWVAVTNAAPGADLDFLHQRTLASALFGRSEKQAWIVSNPNIAKDPSFMAKAQLAIWP